MKRMMALSLACIFLMASACADGLPDGAVVIEDGSFPLTCAMYGDGGLVVSGFEGFPEGKSIGECLFEATWPYPLTDRAAPEPLAGFVAMYNMDGTRRWSHRLPYGDDYQMITPRILPDGRILCLVGSYERMMGGRLDAAAEAFVLDANGDQTVMPGWLDDAFIAQSLPWSQTMSEAWIVKSPPPLDYPAPYAPTLALYDAGMNVKWQAAPAELENFFTQSLYQVGDGYVGFAVDLYDMEDRKPSNIHSCIYKLDANGGFVWKYPLKKGAVVYSLAQTAEGGVIAFGSEEKSSPEEDPVSFFSLLDKDGAEQWYRADCYERYRILGFYQSVSTADGFHYVLGSRGWEVEEGRYAASSVLVRMDDRGEDLRYFPIPEMGVRTAKFCFLQIDGMGRACLVGALEARDNLDRWYILPIHASLFTDVW